MSAEKLEAAHARIKWLEGEIRSARANPTMHEPGRARRIIAGLVFSILVVAITLWAGHRFGQQEARNSSPVAAQASSAPAAAAQQLRPAASELSFQCLGTDNNPYPFGPMLVDLDNDGVREIVSLAWWTNSPRSDAAALYVVAFDRKTHAVRWRSPGIVARCGVDMASRLFVDGRGRVVVRDDADMMNELSSRTGDHVSSSLAREADKKPPPTNASALFDHRLPIVDETRPDRQTLVRAAMRKLDAGPNSPPALSMSMSIHDLVDGFRRVTIANARVNDLESRDMAFGFDEASGALLWQVPLTSPEEKPLVDPPKAVNAWTMLSGGKLSHLYQRTDGAYAISIRNAKTGALIRDVPLNVSGGIRLGAGAPIGGVTSDDNEVFFYLADSLVVFDLETFTTRVIRAF